MMIYGNMSFMSSLGVLLALSLLLALYPSISFYICKKFFDDSLLPIVGPSVFTLLEILRGCFPLKGFPWLAPAYSLYGDILIVQLAEYIGIYGLCFLVYFVNFSLAEPKYFKSRFVKVSILIVALHFVGYGLLKNAEKIESPGPVKIGLIQGNISQDKKWSPEFRDQTKEIYYNLSSDVLNLAELDLVVWPEASIPISISQNRLNPPFSTKFLDESTFLQFGSPSYSGTRKRIYKNSSYLVSSSGEIVQRYDKKLLVPFGEYVPFVEFLPFEKIVPGAAGNFKSGNGSGVFEFDKGAYGNLICYESLFPHLSTDLVREGATFFVNTTNDAWFDYTSGPFQHLQFGRFRSIENRKPFVRVANTGITTWFDSVGRIGSKTTLFERTSLAIEIKPNHLITFYAQYPWLIGIISIIILVGSVIRSRFVSI